MELKRKPNKVTKTFRLDVDVIEGLVKIYGANKDSVKSVSSLANDVLSKFIDDYQKEHGVL